MIAAPSCIADILLTHTHSDHCDLGAIRRLASPGNRRDPIGLWAHPSAPRLELVARLTSEGLIRRMMAWKYPSAGPSYPLQATPNSVAELKSDLTSVGDD